MAVADPIQFRVAQFKLRLLSSPRLYQVCQRLFFINIEHLCLCYIFSVTIRLMYLFGIIPSIARFLGTLTEGIGGAQKKVELLLTGIIEISSGVWTLRDAAASMRSQLVMAAFMMGWAGISVHCGIDLYLEAAASIPHTLVERCYAVLSAILTYFLSGLFKFEAPVASYLVEQLDGIFTLNFASSLKISLTVSVVLTVAMFMFYMSRILIYAPKKRK